MASKEPNDTRGGRPSGDNDRNNSMPQETKARKRSAFAAAADATSTAASRGKNKTEIIYKPKLHDILMGRGKPIQNHPGNVTMRRIVRKNKARYDECHRDARGDIVHELLHVIEESGARFLRRREDPEDKNNTTETWEEIPRSEAYEKLCHALRAGRKAAKKAEQKKQQKQQQLQQKQQTKQQEQQQQPGAACLPAAVAGTVSHQQQTHRSIPSPPTQLNGGAAQLGRIGAPAASSSSAGLAAAINGEGGFNGRYNSSGFNPQVMFAANPQIRDMLAASHQLVNNEQQERGLSRPSPSSSLPPGLNPSTVVQAAMQQSSSLPGNAASMNQFIAAMYSYLAANNDGRTPGMPSSGQEAVWPQPMLSHEAESENEELYEEEEEQRAPLRASADGAAPPFLPVPTISLFSGGDGTRNDNQVNSIADQIVSADVVMSQPSGLTVRGTQWQQDNEEEEEDYDENEEEINDEGINPIVLEVVNDFLRRKKERR